MNIKSNLCKVAILSLLGSSFGACATDEEREPGEPDRATSESAKRLLINYGTRFASQVTRALTSEGLEEILPEDSSPIITESRIALLYAGDLVDATDEDLQAWVEHNPSLSDLLLRVTTYERLVCEDSADSSSCKELDTLRAEVTNIVDTAADRLSGHTNTEAQESWERLVHAPQIQLLASIHLAHMAEGIVLQQMDSTSDPTEEAQESLCAAASGHLQLLDDLEQDLAASFDSRHGQVGFRTEVTPIDDKKEKHRIRACFDTPDGDTCTSKVRIEVYKKNKDGEWELYSTGGPERDELLEDGDALRKHALGTERALLLGSDGFDANRAEFQRIAACVDVPGPQNTFCTLYRDKRINLRSPHGTYLQAQTDTERAVVHSATLTEQSRLTVSCDEAGKISLTTNHATVLIAPTDGSTIGQGSTLDEQRLFMPVHQDDGSWTFQAAHGTYMRAADDDLGTVAQAQEADASTRFQVMNATI